MMAAVRAAPANRVAPAQYSQIVWAILLGALFFDEFPDATAIAGIALVTFAGLFTFVREEKRGARFPPVWTMVWGRPRRRSRQRDWLSATARRARVRRAAACR